MPNNTETYWEAAGQSLHTFARSIETLGGMGPPELRGEDIIVPNRQGQTRVDKVVNSRTLMLAMWVRGVAQDAGSGAVKATKAQYQKNWNDMIRLLWNSGRPFELRKRFYDGDNPNPILATAIAEYKGGLQPTMIGNNAGRCTVDLNLADPYFYSDVLFSQTLVNGDNTVIIPSTADTQNIVITIQGARNNTKIRNKTSGIEFTYPFSLGSGDSVEVRVKDSEVLHTPSGQATYDGSARVIHDGAAHWLDLRPGTNVIAVSSTSGIGTITLQARGAWV